MQLPTSDIIPFIPQRPPFVLISELLQVTELTARSYFKVELTHVLVEQGVLTEAGLVENMAQTAAAKAGYDACLQNSPVANGFITLIKQLEVAMLPPAGADLYTDIEILDQIFNTTIIAGRVYYNNKQIAACQLNVLTEMQQEEGAA